jgi:hypothetical protein
MISMNASVTIVTTENRLAHREDVLRRRDAPDHDPGRDDGCGRQHGPVRMKLARRIVHTDARDQRGVRDLAHEVLHRLRLFGSGFFGHDTSSSQGLMPVTLATFCQRREARTA